MFTFFVNFVFKTMSTVAPHQIQTTKAMTTIYLDCILISVIQLDLAFYQTRETLDSIIIISLTTNDADEDYKFSTKKTTTTGAT